MSKEKIHQWLNDAQEKVSRSKKKDLDLTQFLQEHLRKAVIEEEDAYAESLKSRSYDEFHEAIEIIHKARKKESKRSKDEDQEERKIGFLEKSFDAALGAYFEDQTPEGQEEILNLITQLEVNRRVRFLYDIQKLRISSGNRREANARLFGIKDIFIDYSSSVLEKLEAQNIKMIDGVIRRSTDGKFYDWLLETYVGVGPQMAGCIISELSCPERFRTVSSLWAYTGVHVIGGRCAKRTKGEKSNWNSFLKTKLVGVLADIFVKHQTRYLDTDEEKTKGQNMKCLRDYKNRLHTKNDLIPDSERFYNKKGEELFRLSSDKDVTAYDEGGKELGKVCVGKIPRRSKGHIDNMAKRYMIKMFLCDVLNKWREFKGLEPLPTYDEAKLRNGRAHGE